MLHATVKHCERVTRRLLSDEVAARRWSTPGAQHGTDASLPASVAMRASARVLACAPAFVKFKAGRRQPGCAVPVIKCYTSRQSPTARKVELVYSQHDCSVSPGSARRQTHRLPTRCSGRGSALGTGHCGVPGMIRACKRLDGCSVSSRKPVITFFTLRRISETGSHRCLKTTWSVHTVPTIR